MKASIYILSIALGAFCFGGCTPSSQPLPTQYQIQSGYLRSPAIHYQVSMQKKEPTIKKTVNHYIPVPMPGQLVPLKIQKKISAEKTKKKSLTISDVINNANKKSIHVPNKEEYINSMAVYPYMPGAVYQIYTTPSKITDIQLAENEKLNSISAGDTLRWRVIKTNSGAGNHQYEHVIVKPLETNLDNNLMISTDQRTYHLNLKSTPDTYITALKWRYPDQNNDVLKIFRKQSASDTLSHSAQKLPQLDVRALNFNYHLRLGAGGRPSWSPQMVFNDGYKTYIKFSKRLPRAPALFIGSLSDKKVQPIYYRVDGDYYIIDSLPKSIVLRMNEANKKYPTVIQITYHGH